MPQLTCLDNFENLELESEYRAVLIKRISRYFLATSYIELLFQSLFLSWRMWQYFRQVSLKKLSACYNEKNESCRACLKRIYQFELSMHQDIKNNMLEVPLVGRIMRRLKDNLEDRIETMMLAAEDEIAGILPDFIEHLLQQDQPVSDWRRQLETLR